MKGITERVRKPDGTYYIRRKKGEGPVGKAKGTTLPKKRKRKPARAAIVRFIDDN